MTLGPLAVALILIFSTGALVCQVLEVLRSAWRRREERRALEVVANVEPFRSEYQAAIADANQPPAVVWIPARRGGKLEAQRLVVEAFRADGGVVFVPPKVPAFVELQPKNWRRHPGEFIIGERLAWESRILDGENGPSLTEPRGLFR